MQDKFYSDKKHDRVALGRSIIRSVYEGPHNYCGNNIFYLDQSLGPNQGHSRLSFSKFSNTLKVQNLSLCSKELINKEKTNNLQLNKILKE